MKAKKMPMSDRQKREMDYTKRKEKAREEFNKKFDAEKKRRGR